MSEFNLHFYMEKALAQARKAASLDEVPVGALVVDSNGVIVTRAFNKVESTHTQSAHAELLALAKAGKKRGDWRLEGCWLYVTLEPCAMCMNLIIMSRLAGIVYGASSPLFGFQGVDIPTSGWLYKKNMPAIIAGIKSEESAALLKKFFKNKRESTGG